jgi:hypothetical protein
MPKFDPPIPNPHFHHAPVIDDPVFTPMKKDLRKSPHFHHAPVIDDPVLVRARLQELHPDLHISIFHDAIRGGLSGRNETTRASAPTAPGIQQWLKTVEDLRTLLATMQWHIHEERNCPFISSPEQKISIVVMTGSSETGKNGLTTPTNQAEKGSVAESFSKKNQFELFFNQNAFEFVKENKIETRVWVLLYHYDKMIKEVRFELSLPTGFDNRKITEWGERLILGSIPNNPDDFTIPKDKPNPPASVEVVPKTGTF